MPARGEIRRSFAVGDLRREPLSFRRRKGLLADIDKVLAAKCTAVFLGARGVGRTHLAAARARDWNGIVVWIVADAPANVVATLVELAKSSVLADEIADAHITAKEVLRRLAGTKTNVLLVFDNEKDVDALGVARVLITTTNYDFAILGGVVHVGGFGEDEAVAFLCDRADLEPSPKARALAVELGLRPLALAQAGWVLRQRRLSFTEYLTRFRARRWTGSSYRCRARTIPAACRRRRCGPSPKFRTLAALRTGFGACIHRFGAGLLFTWQA